MTSVAGQIRRGRELLRQRLEWRTDEQRDAEYQAWHDRNERLLRALLVSGEESEAFLRAAYQRTILRGRLAGSDLLCDLREEIQDLDSVADRIGVRSAALEPAAGSLVIGQPPASVRVLIVHGRKEAPKEKVARFLLKLGLEPILLDEQASLGMTLIEKIEIHSAVAFAVVLLTGDDIGGLASEPGTLRPRARQNVIFELGFLSGRLSRERVCALYEEGVELPSDFRGVEYKPLDAAGAWKAKLAKELYEAGLRFDPLRVF